MSLPYRQATWEYQRESEYSVNLKLFAFPLIRLTLYDPVQSFLLKFKNWTTRKPKLLTMKEKMENYYQL